MRRFMLMALATVAAGCSGNVDDVAPEDGRDQILFDVNEIVSKASGQNSAMSSASSFGSYAWHSPADGSGSYAYIPVEEVSCKDNVWKAWGTGEEQDHTYYWPSDGTMSFFGWSPYSIAGRQGFTCGKDGYELAGWNTLESQDDLMTAVTERDCAASHAAVTMTFSHALSALTFLLKVSNDPSETLTSCWLESADRSFCVSGTLGFTSGGGLSWSGLGTAASDVRHYYDWECAGIPLGSDDGVRPYTKLASVVKGDLFASNSGYIFIVPQTTASEKLSFHFYVKDASGHSVERSAFLPAEEYKAGKKYEYTITISPVLDVSVTIRDWNMRYVSDDITF